MTESNPFVKKMGLEWEPSKLELVSNQMVDSYFAPLDDEDWEDLKLPVRPNLTSYVICKL
ncbi:putative 3-hydroxyisobutyryl-CoA hydrolase [Helianthus anomalus]